MFRSRSKAAVLLVLVIGVLLGVTSAVSAASWSDIDDGVLSPYGVTADQLSQVSSGYPDGTWHPRLDITRGQFAKMAVTAFGVATVTPEVPTFSDVAPADLFYTYVEGAYAAGLMQGVGDGRFDAGSPVTREQAVAVVARKVAAGHGYDLAGMTEAEIGARLAAFSDGSAVSASLRDEMAFALKQGLVKGKASGELSPRVPMSRLAAAVVLIRATAPRPLVLDMNDDGGTVKVKVGDTIHVVLKGNPTTGYTWTADLTPEAAAILEQVGEPSYVADSDLIGAGGTFTFTFRALAAGEAQLRLDYARPWESAPPLKTFSVTVSVEAASGGADALLDGTSWKLTGWPVSSLNPQDFEITATFEDGRIGGRAAVNLYGAPYTADASGAFSVGIIIQTKMAGPAPAMLAETTYFGLLQGARSYVLSGDTLKLLGEGGGELLIFAPAAAH